MMSTRTAYNGAAMSAPLDDLDYAAEGAAISGGNRDNG